MSSSAYRSVAGAVLLPQHRSKLERSMMTSVALRLISLPRFSLQSAGYANLLSNSVRTLPAVQLLFQATQSMSLRRHPCRNRQPLVRMRATDLPICRVDSMSRTTSIKGYCVNCHNEKLFFLANFNAEISRNPLAIASELVCCSARTSSVALIQGW